MNAILTKVELFAADGGGDMQLAGRELASAMSLSGPRVPELEGVLAQSLPGLKARARDEWQRE